MRTVICITALVTLSSASLDAGFFPANVLALAKARGQIPVTTEAGSEILYMFNNSHTVPGSVELLEFDIAAKSYKTVFTSSNAQNDCLSASIVCGDTYYAVWTFFPAAAGVLKVDLKTGKGDYLPTGGESYIYHGFQCDKNTSSLMGIASQMGKTKSGQFQLVSLDTTSGHTTTIGNFPSETYLGQDGTFRFTEDGSELYAAFAGALPPSSKDGTLYIMDTVTGKIKENHKVPTTYGEGYAVYPSSSDSFSFAFTKEGVVTLCTATKSGTGGGIFAKPLKLSSCTKLDALGTGSAPSPVCGGKVIAVANNIGGGPGSSQPFNQIDLSTGKATPVVDLSKVIPGSYIGTVACGN